MHQVREPLHGQTRSAGSAVQSLKRTTCTQRQQTCTKSGLVCCCLCSRAQCADRPSIGLRPQSGQISLLMTVLRVIGDIRAINKGADSGCVRARDGGRREGGREGGPSWSERGGGGGGGEAAPRTGHVVRAQPTQDGQRGLGVLISRGQ